MNKDIECIPHNQQTDINDANTEHKKTSHKKNVNPSMNMTKMLSLDFYPKNNLPASTKK